MSPVYFIQVGDDGPVKIGQSADPIARLASLQTAHYEQLHLRGLALEQSEDDLHQRFAGHALNGEWFSPHPVILDAVEVPMDDFLRSLEAIEALRKAAEMTSSKLRVGAREEAVIGAH